MLALLGLAGVAAIATAVLLLGGGSSSSGHPTRVRAKVAPGNAATSLLGPPRSHARVVEPQAGVVSDGTAPTSGGGDVGAPSGPDPAPTGAASAGAKPTGASAGNVQADTAAVQDGIALPPIGAPDAVTAIIQAGNQIARTPYLWGGGHGRWLDHGYDCSGSVSYALAAAGYLNGPLTSGQLAHWGRSGPGRWVTIYANAGHVWMTVAGARFDTSGRDSRNGGSRWQDVSRSTAGFTVRHPVGL